MKTENNILDRVKSFNPLTTLKMLLKYGFIIMAVVKGIQTIIHELEKNQND